MLDRLLSLIPGARASRSQRDKAVMAKVEMLGAVLRRSSNGGCGRRTEPAPGGHSSPVSATLGTDRVGSLVPSGMDEWIVERADAVGYWELAANAGWSPSEAAKLLETAGAITAGFGSSADPVTVAMAWLGTSP